jgi:RNA polymerase sigma-70 factor, ECF subfamily
MNRDLDQQQQYLSSLYELYADALFRFVYWKTSNKDVALDIVQDTFTKTWDYLQKGGELDNSKAFLYRVAGNLIIDYRRKKKSLSLDYVIETGGDIDAEDLGHQRAIARIEFEQLHDILASLSEKERTMITLRYIEDMSISEIAETLKERPNTVSVTIHRAIEKLHTKVNQSTL